jgi:hypothetical protein
MSGIWCDNDNVPTATSKAKAFSSAIKLSEFVVGLPVPSWEHGDAALEIESMRAASRRCLAAARATTHPEMKVRLATGALKLALEAEALSRSSLT